MNAAPKPAPVHDDASALLELLAPDESVTFQTFGEGSREGDQTLTRTLHGTLAEHRRTLAALNARGAGVYWMVNAGDGKGRKATNVQRIRALFVDLDGAPLAPVQAAPLSPHAIVESSPNRWHAYWRVADCPLADFKPLQQALAARFDADRTVCDLPRVLRLPGFDHRKGKPYRSRVIELHPHQPYTITELVQAFDLHAPETHATGANVARLPSAHQRRTLPDVIPEGERNAKLFSLACGFAQRGHGLQAVNDRLQRINAERCTPPLGADEVDAIATQAVSYGSDGFAMLPYKLLDSPAWKALTPRAQAIIVLALRRFRRDDPEAGIALTWADFAERPSFAKKDTFYHARNEAQRSGILELVSAGRNRQTGKMPSLFTVAVAFRFPSPEKVTLRQSRKSTPLHREQEGGLWRKGITQGGAARTNGRAGDEATATG